MLNKLKPIASLILNNTGITRALSSGWRVLMYHRIIDPEKSILKLQAGMYVRPETFRMQMQFLAKKCNVIPFEQLVTALIKKERLPKRTIAITFDDGWIDNYEFAFPILKEANLPATIFLPTEYISTGKLYWTDRFSVIAELFREQEAEVEFLSKNVAVELALKNLFKKDSDFDSLLEECILLLKQLEQKERMEIIDALEDFMQLKPEMIIPPQFLNWQQVKLMQEHKISFGSHSHSHIQLGRCDASEVTREIITSFNTLKSQIKNPSKIFCYPEGSFSEISQAALAKLQFKAVAANSKSDTSLKSSPPIIGRIGIHQDISAKRHMFKNRIWCNKLF